MDDETLVPVPETAAAATSCSADAYDEARTRSLDQSEAFWLKEARRLDWMKSPTVAGNWRFAPDVDIKWFEDGELNACWNCVDRHAVATPDRTAIICEPDDPAAEVRRLTYAELKRAT
ncbi:MAG: acetyl-coenzyme A synthetase N-terminal domain-containing protein, partial [Pseudomonadota bacterium]